MLTTRSGRNPSQNEFELRSFIALLQEHGATRYLEIGARHGDTFHEVMLGLPPGSRGLAVDLPGGLWGTVKSRSPLKDSVIDLRQRGYLADALFGDSQTAATHRLVAARAPFDAILIDGDHTLPGVTRDWELYQGLAPIIAFHDIVGDGQIEKVGGRPVEVPLLWAELRDQYHHVEFIAPGSTMGVGVLWME